MKALLAVALFLPFHNAHKADEWQPYTSFQSRMRFEMPTEPVEQNFCSRGGEIRSYSSEKNELVYEATAMEMVSELKEAIMDVVSDAETTVSRQLLDGFVENSLEELEAKADKTEYGRFMKLPCRTTTATLPGKREARMMSVVGKNHAYLFIVSYPQGSKGDATIKRFLDSIRFEN
jgi:hypothetical protein